MALIDRALQKAYRRPVRDLAAVPPIAPAARERGWVEGVRAPRIPKESPIPETISPRSDQSSAAIATTASIPDDPAVTTQAAPETAGELSTSIAPVCGHDAAAPSWKWPRICDAILASPARGELQQFIGRLYESFLRLGSRCVLFTSVGAGTGQSSIVLTLTRLLCERTPLRILAVDWNLEHPHLTQLLNVKTDHGSTAAAAGGHSGLSAPVSLIPGRFDLASLAQSAAPPIDGQMLHAAGGAMLRETRSRFDLILIDAGAWENSGRFAARECRPGDAMVRVVSADDAAGDAAAHEDSSASGAGLEILGVIETFLRTGDQRCTKATGD